MKSFLIALQFLSRFQVARQTEWTERDFGGAVVWFPLVGTVIGAFLWLVCTASMLIFPPSYGAVLVAAAWFFITGGLHADGFMDTADGLFSGRSRERMLEIMKDSRVGANGVMAFFFLAAFKICFLASLPSPAALEAVIAVPTAARFSVLVGIFEFPYAREQGLGQYFVRCAPPHALLKAFGCSLLPLAYCGAAYAAVIGAALLLSLAFNSYVAGKLGGVTGDTYGACIEWSEAALLGLLVLAEKTIQTAAFQL